MGKTFVLCSPFAGTAITGDGEPAAGVEVERQWTWGWNDESGSDRTVTDAQGRFSFPVVEGSSFTASFLPHEPHVSQRIIAHTKNGDVEIWFAAKRSYELNSEMDGRPTKVICNLDREPSDAGLYWGTCVEDK
ncbi:hypothetical protein BGP75_03485 [Motiliproteus sp. MSK22-1]|nr:hypothetical protein BGP75_03485 [Motiliproteus sp. MSK22-1]